LSGITHVTDRQTDRQTEFSSLDRVSAVKIQGESLTTGLLLIKNFSDSASVIYDLLCVKSRSSGWAFYFSSGPSYPMGPLGPGPGPPSLRGPPNSPCVIFSSCEI